MQIKSILVSAVAPFNDHIANGGEKILGNASSIKRRPDGRVYVSGQMQRHVLFSAIERLNNEGDNGGTFVSTGDGTTNQIEKDLRADLGGFMHPSKGDYSGRRTAPVSVTPAVAIRESDVGRDLLVRIRMTDDAREQALATREYSARDEMMMNFFLDVSTLSISQSFDYKDQLFISRKHHRHADDAERMRRAMLFLNGTRYMNDYANQARNAVAGEPSKVLIVISPLFSRKASRYFAAGEMEQKNLLAELDSQGARYFLGDDTTAQSVAKAYDDAIAFMQKNENVLYDPTNGGPVVTYEEYLSTMPEKSKAKAAKKGKDGEAENADTQ